ncbi:MAG: metallophosphoesterase family protein [Bacteroidota bacterium]
MHIGIISDTHGLLRPEAIQALTGVAHILHAGDVGKVEVLDHLTEIAPVTVIRGNVDRRPGVGELPLTEAVELGGVWFYLVHDIEDLDIDPIEAGMQVVVYGHSHIPKVEEKNGVLFVNPGSAGPRRFKLPVTLMRMNLDKRPFQPEWVHLL